jgi:hypothetical protein
MRIHPLLVPIFFIAALLGTVFVAQSAGVWSTSGRTEVSAQSLAPADLKGWMTLQQVIDGIGIPQAELYQIAHIPADMPATTALKDLEGSVPGFEITALREALESRPAATAPSTMAPTASAPAAATPIPTAPAATAMPTAAGAAHATPTPLPPGEVLPGSQVKGRMTLQEVSDQCAVPLDRLLQALGLPADTGPAVAIKDLVSQGQLADVTAVQQAVTQLQSH